MHDQYDVIILGSGPAGLTAGLYTGRARLRTLMLGERPGGNPVVYDCVDNFPGFPGGVPGAQLMMGMVKQVDDLGVERLVEDAGEVLAAEETFQVTTEGAVASAPALIVATGSHPVRLGAPGEAKFVGKGVYYCAHCDAPVFRMFDKARAVVVGGGNSAAYTALYMTRYAEEVIVVHRGETLRADPIDQEAVRAHPKIRVLLQREVAEVLGEEGHLRSVVLRDARTGDRTELEAEGIFVGIGQKPNSQLLQGLVDLTDDGFIRVDHTMRTSRDGVFAAGDVVDKALRQIVTAAGDGAVAADSAIKYLAAGRGASCCSRRKG